MRLNEGDAKTVIRSIWRLPHVKTNNAIPSTINGLFVEECEESSRYEDNCRNGDEQIRHSSGIHFGNDLQFTLPAQRNRNSKQEREEGGSNNLNGAKEQRTKSDRNHPVDGITEEHRKRVLVGDSVLTPLVAEFSMVNEMLHLSLLLHPSLVQPLLHAAMNLLVSYHFLRNDLRYRSLRVVNVTLIHSPLRIIDTSRFYRTQKGLDFGNAHVMLPILAGRVGNFSGVGRILHRAVADVAFVALRGVVFAKTFDKGEETGGARQQEVLQLGTVGVGGPVATPLQRVCVRWEEKGY